MTWLNHDELLEFINDLRDVIAPRLANEARPGRTRYLVSPIHFPAEARMDET